MKKLFFLVALVIILTFTTSVFAGKPEPVGDPLPNDVDSWTANTPFHIQHGWVGEDVNMRYTYRLELDGKFLKFDIFTRELNQEDDWTWLWTYNFPDGLVGEHTFTHHMYVVCEDFFEDCKSPNKSVEILTRTQLVSFED